ncbi:tetratricopeptide repeat protein [Dactylosporangium sp. CA-139066]|uniref:tetratricopeptide repeat protein n=1 Tax=Dactylosporangium sp. CA-139066 TaxID=3239930 RepID=UPI003D94ACAD
MLAQDRGDYAKAERRYQQSRTISEKLGDQAGIAISLSQLANLRTATSDSAAATPLLIQALSIRLAIGVPQAVNDIRDLVDIRDQIGENAFSEAGCRRRLLRRSHCAAGCRGMKNAARAAPEGTARAAKGLLRPPSGGGTARRTGGRRPAAAGRRPGS